MSIYKQLSNIQNELKAPKNQRNNFGNYNYRSAEDILEAVKPLCAKHELTLVVSDDMVLLGDRYYIKAIATLYNDQGETVSANAYARESETKKGMDSSQITGSTSSYARKYALNGLFNIDDTKDADFTNTHDKPTKYDKAPQPTTYANIQEAQKAKIIGMVQEGTFELDKMLAYYGVNSVDELNFDQASEIINKKGGKQ